MIYETFREFGEKLGNYFNAIKENKKKRYSPYG